MKCKFLNTLIFLCFGIVFSQSKTEELEINRIDHYVEKINKDTRVRQFKFDVKGKNATIHYSYYKKNNEFVRISREWDEQRENYIYSYSDDFVIENGKKVYASQNETWKLKTDFENLSGWYCQFYIKNNVVFHMPSMGHGKTELDDWDYEKELKENYAYMLKTVKTYDKKKIK